MKHKWLKMFSILILVACLVLAWLNFSGWLPADSFKLWFLILSLVYFISATLSMSDRARNQDKQ